LLGKAVLENLFALLDLCLGVEKPLVFNVDTYLNQIQLCLRNFHFKVLADPSCNIQSYHRIVFSVLHKQN